MPFDKINIKKINHATEYVAGILFVLNLNDDEYVSICGILLIMFAIIMLSENAENIAIELFDGLLENVRKDFILNIKGKKHEQNY